MPEEAAEWQLPRRPRSVGRARALLRAQAADWKPPDAITDTAVLLLSELMTNVYRHAHVSPGREIRIRCALDDDEWGTAPRPHGVGKTIWFSLGIGACEDAPKSVPMYNNDLPQ